MVDYVSVLDGAVAALDPNTKEARHVLYDRARRALVDGLRASDPTLAHTALQKEAAALESAIQRVETVWQHRTAQPEQEPAHQADNPSVEETQDRPPLKEGYKPLHIIVGVVGVLILLFACLAAYWFWPRSLSPARNLAGRTTVPERSTTGAAYVYLRQPVYYRTIHPVGTIVVDKAQNFLYVVRPSLSALRYGIGVGPECTATAGLYQIVRKEEWPGWKPSPQQSAHAGDDQMKNPLGARALYLSKDYRIHGTNIPAWIGRPTPLGCIRLVNEDVIHLYDRAPLETRVVVLN